jgi:hypothetical protein
VLHVTEGDGGIDRITVDANGSRIMMQGVQRATPYGYSLYEMELHGSVATGVNPTAGLPPPEFGLNQNYPNPFNPVTNIGYTIGVVSGQSPAPRSTAGPVASMVKLAVYDLLGREVAVLVHERKTPGESRVSFDGSRLSSGVYICRLTASDQVLTRKIVLLR